MNQITPIRPAVISEPLPAAADSGGNGFGRLLEAAIERVEHHQAAAAQAVESLLTGEGGELHNVALATQRAELAMELFLQVRNKVVQAYQEIMRMQV